MIVDNNEKNYQGQAVSQPKIFVSKITFFPLFEDHEKKVQVGNDQE